jgi:hypothetical protein
MTNGKLEDQEVAYLVQVLTTRPLGEALPLWLKLTGQEVVKVGPNSPTVPGPPHEARG